MADKKKYYWLKLQDGFFTQPKIKKLRRIAGGDTYTIIYLKMQLLSLKNEGKLYFEGIEETFAEELALDLDEDVENVSITINFLFKYGLIEEVEIDEFALPETMRSIGSETAGAERMRRLRQKQKEVKLLQSCDDASHCDSDVTSSDTEKEKRREDKEKRERADYNGIKDAYNSLCPSLPSVKSLSDARKKAIKARLNTYSVDDLYEVFRKAEASDFLTGKNDRNWQANFDWIIKDANIAKILDGNYDNKSGGGKSSNRVANELDEFYRMAEEWSESDG